MIYLDKFDNDYIPEFDGIGSLVIYEDVLEERKRIEEFEDKFYQWLQLMMEHDRRENYGELGFNHKPSFLEVYSPLIVKNCIPSSYIGDIV